jgi:hypothetical protein
MGLDSKRGRRITRAVMVVLGVIAIMGCDREREPRQTMSTAVKSVAKNPIAHRVRPHLDHTAFFKTPMTSGPEVTARCLECHPKAAAEVMKTGHYTWLSGDEQRDGKLVRIGKRNLINNFCISVISNWASCTRCHAGYGWTDANYAFDQQDSVDCLVCHEGTGTYVKDKGGLPAPKVNLAKVAGSVRAPGRDNCGGCHFNGGGGMGVKHGDLDASLLNPSEDIDVHMGRLDFECVDCHETHEHLVPGKVNSTYTAATTSARFDCVDCHDTTPHADQQLNKHVARVACQTCHIPAFARKYPTKMTWDWSQAGDALQGQPARVPKIKGVSHEENVHPLTAGTTPHGPPHHGRHHQRITGIGPRLPEIWRIFPFKIHRAGGSSIGQPHPAPTGHQQRGRFWSEFDWQLAVEGAEARACLTAGTYDFTASHMLADQSHGGARQGGARMYRVPRRSGAPRLEGARLRRRSRGR